MLRTGAACDALPVTGGVVQDAADGISRIGDATVTAGEARGGVDCGACGHHWVAKVLDVTRAASRASHRIRSVEEESRGALG